MLTGPEKLRALSFFDSTLLATFQIQRTFAEDVLGVRTRMSDVTKMGVICNYYKISTLTHSLAAKNWIRVSSEIPLGPSMIRCSGPVVD